ncbi:hypothetical protein [Candidatus Vidania fulgoroideorum]
MIKEIIKDIEINIGKVITLGKIKVINRIKPYKIKFGIDISSNNIHIGHLLCLLVIKKIARKVGNIEIVIIIGNYTVGIVRNVKRGKIKKYVSNIKKVISQVLFSKNWKVLFFENSTWLTKFEHNSYFKIGVDKLIRSKKENKTIGQLVYPYLQNYDNIIIKPDIEIGGMDQLYNFSFYNKLIKAKKMLFILIPLIKTLRDKKMSKSKRNCIYIYNDYKDMFWNILRFEDSNIREYLKIFSNATNFKNIKLGRNLDVNINNKLNLFLILSKLVFKKYNIRYIKLYLKKKIEFKKVIKVKRRNLSSLRVLLKKLGIVRYTSELKQLIKVRLITVNNKQLKRESDIKKEEIKNISIGKRTKIVIY